MFNELTNEELMTIDGGVNWCDFGIGVLGAVATIASASLCVGAAVIGQPLFATGMGALTLAFAAVTAEGFYQAFTN